MAFKHSKESWYLRGARWNIREETEGEEKRRGKWNIWIANWRNWLGFRHTVVILGRGFHSLAMLSTSQKDTPFSCLAMAGLNSLFARAQVLFALPSPPLDGHRLSAINIEQSFATLHCLYVPVAITSFPSVLISRLYQRRTKGKLRSLRECWTTLFVEFLQRHQPALSAV